MKTRPTKTFAVIHPKGSSEVGTRRFHDPEEPGLTPDSSMRFVLIQSGSLEYCGAFKTDVNGKDRKFQHYVIIIRPWG